MIWNTDIFRSKLKLMAFHDRQHEKKKKRRRERNIFSYLVKPHFFYELGNHIVISLHLVTHSIIFLSTISV